MRYYKIALEPDLRQFSILHSIFNLGFLIAIQKLKILCLSLVGEGGGGGGRDISILGCIGRAIFSGVSLFSQNS